MLLLLDRHVNEYTPASSRILILQTMQIVKMVGQGVAWDDEAEREDIPGDASFFVLPMYEQGVLLGRRHGVSQWYRVLLTATVPRKWFCVPRSR